MNAATRCTPTNRFRGPCCVTTGAQRPAEVAAQATRPTRPPPMHARRQQSAHRRCAERTAHRRNRRQGSRSHARRTLQAGARPSTRRRSSRAACTTKTTMANATYLSEAELSQQRVDAAQAGRKHLRPPGLISSQHSTDAALWAAFSYVALRLMRLIIRAYDARRICRPRCHGCSHGEKSPQSGTAGAVWNRSARKGAGAFRGARLPAPHPLDEFAAPGRRAS